MPPIFSKTPIDNELDEEIELESNVKTMQDDVVDAIEKKNRSSFFGKALRKTSGRSKEIQRDLADVYTDNDGLIPDLTKLDRDERPWWQTTLYSLVVIFAVIFAVSVAGFLIYSNWNKDTFTNENVTFKVNPPISIVSGQDQVYTIIISNKEGVNLYDLNIQLSYPDTFQYVSGTPEATGEKKNTWDVSALKIGETKELQFIGRITAGINTVHNLSGTMTFKPENLNADFNQKSSVDLGVNSSILTVTITGPEKTIANKTVEYVVTLKNVGVEVLKDLDVSAEYPLGFSFVSSTPDSEDGFNNIWKIAKLATSTIESATSTDTKIKIRGNYAGIIDSGNQEFKIKVNLKQGGNLLLMAESSAVTNIVKNQLDISMVINGSAEDSAVGFGDLLFYTFNYKNTGQDELKNIELTANLNSEVLDWDTLLDENKGIKKNNTITWTGKEVPNLLSLRPGEEGEISWQIRVKDLSAVNKDDIVKFNIENIAEAKINKADGSSETITGKTLTNAINSDLSLQAAARYYNEENIPLGAGPISPKAGEASSYNIKINLSNNLHDIGNIEVTAVLPKNVKWDNKENHNTGDISYNTATGKITWKISKLLKVAPGAEASFNVSLTPAESDIGRVLILLPEIKLVAKDLDTGSDISKTAKAITTAFSDPIMGAVSGIVE